MKKYALMVVSAAALTLLGNSPLRAEGICDRKIQNLERQLAIAESHNNTDQARGLQSALRNVRLWCSDSGELAKAEMDVLEKQDKLEEREAELAESLADGKKKEKIAKRRLKVEEAKKELADAEKKRDGLKQ